MNLLELCLAPGYGGLELYALKVIQHFADTGRPCNVMVRKGSFLDSKLAEQGISRDPLSVLNRNLPLLAAFKLARYLRQYRIDTIHIHWRGDVSLVVLARVLSRRQLRIVYTRHMALTRPKHDLFHRFIYRHIDALVVITKKLQQDALEFLPIEKERIRVVYHGVAEPVAPAPEACAAIRENFTHRSFTVALFGRIEKGKGQHVLVEAISRLGKKGLIINVALYGHVMDKAYFQQLKDHVSRQGLDSQVHYFGLHPDPQRIMACFDVVVLATRCETFGLVLIEAMRAGVAVIGTDCGGVPEIIQHGQTGLLVVPEDVSELAAALEKLATGRLLCQRLAEQGKAFADATFSETEHFRQLEQVLRPDAGTGDD